ncbi:MAG TPA: acyltransferase, partial [Psychromonas hadalis]|nr:acyltransferase [Psychromonas hadalis]
ARANRIIPTLAALCLALLVFGWFFLPPFDYKTLAKHIPNSLGFFSNIAYWKESGYFEAASKEKWLLHTWSLSVEWQFYILYPLVLITLKRFLTVQNLKKLLLITTLLGFIFSVIMTMAWPGGAYFLFPARAWEMLLGGIAYIYPLSLDKKKSKLLEMAGLALVLGSYIFISEDAAWPGYLAAFPVFGAFLILQAERNDSLLTGNVVFQKIGKWSYSIYLWHWPVVVAINYYLIENFAIPGLVISLLLGYLSYRFIESKKFPPFTQWKSILKVKAVWMTLAVGSIALFIIINNGSESRYKDSTVNLANSFSEKIVMPLRRNGYCYYYFDDDKSLTVDKHKGTECFLGDKESQKKVNTLVFGSSFAGHTDPFWDSIFKKEKQPFQSVSTSWCSPIFSDDFTGPKSDTAYGQCLLNREFLKKSIQSNAFKNIIFGDKWDDVLEQGYMDQFYDVVKLAASQGIHVFIMPVPTYYSINVRKQFLRAVYFDKLPLNLAKYEELNSNDVNEYLTEKFANMENVYMIPKKALYSPTNTFQYNGITVPYSFEGRHQSVIGAINAASYFMKSESYDSVMSHFIFDK